MRNLITAFILGVLLTFFSAQASPPANLEDPRQQAIGAQPPIASLQLTPTAVLTSVSISGRAFALQVTITPIATSTVDGQATQETSPTRRVPPLSLTLILFALCCALLLVIGVFVLGFVARYQNMKAGKHDQ